MDLELTTLRRLMGRAGETLWRYANGLDDTPVQSVDAHEDPKSIGSNGVGLFIVAAQLCKDLVEGNSHGHREPQLRLHPGAYLLGYLPAGAKEPLAAWRPYMHRS